MRAHLAFARLNRLEAPPQTPPNEGLLALPLDSILGPGRRAAQKRTAKRSGTRLRFFRASARCHYVLYRKQCAPFIGFGASQHLAGARIAFGKGRPASGLAAAQHETRSLRAHCGFTSAARRPGPRRVQRGREALFGGGKGRSPKRRSRAGAQARCAHLPPAKPFFLEPRAVPVYR